MFFRMRAGWVAPGISLPSCTHRNSIGPVPAAETASVRSLPAAALSTGPGSRVRMGTVAPLIPNDREMGATRSRSISADARWPRRSSTVAMNVSFSPGAYLFDQILKGRFDERLRVLDAGCGDGRNLTYFLRRGFACFGIDRDGEA